MLLVDKENRASSEELYLDIQDLANNYDDFGNLNDDKKVESQENAFSNFGKCFSFNLFL